MDLYTFIHSFVLLWVLCTRSGYSKQCNGRDQCACTYDSDSSVVDLTSLGNKDLTPRSVNDSPILFSVFKDNSNIICLLFQVRMFNLLVIILAVSLNLLCFSVLSTK